MFQEDFESQKDKDETADKFCFGFVAASEKVSDTDTCDRDDHGRDADYGDRLNDRCAEKCKSNTNSKGINTCGNSEHQHVFVIDRGIFHFYYFFFVPFTDCL